MTGYKDYRKGKVSVARALGGHREWKPIGIEKDRGPAPAGSKSIIDREFGHIDSEMDI